MFRKSLKSDFPSLMIILLIPFVIIGGALLPNKALLPTDLLSIYPAWQGSLDSLQASNALLSDVALQFYPWHQLAYEEAQSTGRFPLWNPYELTGQPLVANAQSALYYPPNFMLHWVSPDTVAVICAYFNLVMLGLFTFYFCREISLGKLSSLFASVTIMLCGPVIAWLEYPIVNSLASFPLMLLAGEKILNGRRLAQWIGVLGVGIGFSILGGHPETTFNICFAFGLYFLFRLIIKKPGIKRAVIWMGAVVAGISVGLLLGAMQWLPFADFLLHSATLTEGGRSMGGAHIFFSSDWLYNIATGVTLLIPDFFGSPLANNYYWPFPNYQNYNEQAVYFGLIPLALALYALFWRPRKPQVPVLVGISLFFLVVAWRLPGFEVVNHIPPFSLFLNKRLIMFVPLMMAIVSGIGLEEWLAPEQSGRPGLLYRIPAFLPALFSLAIFGLIGSANIFFPSLNIQQSTFRSFITHLVYQVFNINQPRIMISLAVAVIFVLLLLLNWRRIISRVWFATTVLIVTLVELLVLAWHYNPVTNRNLVYPEIPILSIMQQESQPFRTMSVDLSIFPPNAGAVYRVAQIEGYDYPVFQAFYDIYRAQGGNQASHRQVWSIDFPLVDWLNIRYVISPVPIQRSGYRLVLGHPSYKVYRNENAFPRAYMVYDYQVIENRVKLLQTMISTPEVLKEKAYFSQPPAEIPEADTSISTDAPSQVEFVHYATDSSVLKVNAAHAGFLVMSDLYTQDWKAKIDGLPASVINADYAYRAVYIPAGQHQVEFYYAPVTITIGKFISLLGGLVLFGLWLMMRLHQRKSSAI